MLRRAYGCFDKIITVSASQLDWLHASDLVAPSRSKVIHHCTNLEPLFALKLPKPSLPVVFGAIGRFCYQKGFDELIESWKKLAPENALLLMAGYGENERSLREMAEGYPSIRILGPSDAAAFFPSCHWTIVPSRYEPFGQVCLESKAAGRPVVVTEVDGLPEQVHPTECGLVCDSRSLGCAIEHAIKVSVSSPDSYEAMCLRARESARASFDGYAARITSLLQEETSSLSRTEPLPVTPNTPE